MKNDEINKKVFDWINTQGYTLEMKVAREFQKNGFSVNSGVFYKDPQSKLAREIDLQISKSTFLHEDRLILSINFIVECKYSKDKPWILFRSNNNSYTYSNMVFQSASYYGKLVLLELSLTDVFKNNYLFGIPPSIYYGMTRAFESKKDISYTAIMNVCNAIDSMVLKEDENSEYLKAYSTHIYFPVIIVDSRLFECSLNGSNEIGLDEIKWGKIYCQNPELNNSRYLVDVVSYHHLSEYVALITGASGEIIKYAPSKLEGTVKKLLNVIKGT